MEVKFVLGNRNLVVDFDVYYDPPNPPYWSGYYVEVGKALRLVKYDKTELSKEQSKEVLELINKKLEKDEKFYDYIVGLIVEKLKERRSRIHGR